MTGQKITIQVHDREAAPSKKVAVVENSKYKDNLKKDAKTLGEELKSFGTHFYKMFISLAKASLYALKVFGDLILIWKGNNKNKATTEGTAKKEKNILDEGW